MNEKQLTNITRLAQQQREQIKRLVNLLLSVLDGKPGSDVEATEYLFIQTELYKYIDVGGDAALRQEEKMNELKRRVVEMQLRQHE